MANKFSTSKIMCKRSTISELLPPNSQPQSEMSFFYLLLKQCARVGSKCGDLTKHRQNRLSYSKAFIFSVRYVLLHLVSGVCSENYWLEFSSLEHHDESISRLHVAKL